jgi:hypothetical protein
MDNDKTRRFSEMFGEPGKAVPEVDPDDLRAVAREYRNIAKTHTGERFGIDIDVLRRFCKPGADIRAVCYRHMHLGLLSIIGQYSRSPESGMAEFQDKVATI